jgi:hypothetical protein
MFGYMVAFKLEAKVVAYTMFGKVLYITVVGVAVIVKDWLFVEPV